MMIFFFLINRFVRYIASVSGLLCFEFASVTFSLWYFPNKLLFQSCEWLFLQFSCCHYALLQFKKATKKLDSPQKCIFCLGFRLSSVFPKPTRMLKVCFVVSSTVAHRYWWTMLLSAVLNRCSLASVQRHIGFKWSNEAVIV